MSSTIPPTSAQRHDQRRQDQSGAKMKHQYLVAYNTTSAVLWSVVLARTLLLIPMVGTENVYGGVGNFTKWTQTLALLEIVHALVGLVRTPLMTTVIQVASRINLVWPILHLCSDSMRDSKAYSSMIVAWSITEIIRYSYYALNLQGEPPAWLTTLRYNTFFVLYPMGIASEAWEIFGSLHELQSQYPLIGYVEKFVLFITYVPGAYIMYSHMMHQRRKVMRGKKPMRS